MSWFVAVHRYVKLTIDRAKVYASIMNAPFNGILSQAQVGGIEDIQCYTKKCNTALHYAGATV